MEYVILGLLMLSPATSYEIRNFIKNNLAMICSDSAGSVQTALNKLLKQQHITFTEQIEKGKNKKTYTIAPQGQQAFNAWIQEAMNPSKVKNMELSKLFFLGLAERDMRRQSIEQYIQRVQEIKVILESLKYVLLGLPKEEKEKYTKEEVKVVYQYQLITLQYGIDFANFEIGWYQKLLKEMEEEQ